jgi:hypothetical protein
MGIAVAPFDRLQGRRQLRGQFPRRGAGAAFFRVHPQGCRLQDAQAILGGDVYTQFFAFTPAFQEHLDAFVVELVTAMRQGMSVAVNRAEIGQQYRFASHLRHARAAKVRRA